MEAMKEIDPCEWGTYPEYCKCCGMSLFEAKEYKHRPNRYEVYKIKKNTYCSRECANAFDKYPGEFGQWWNS
jgi:hypothetical protein